MFGKLVWPCMAHGVPKAVGGIKGPGGVVAGCVSCLRGVLKPCVQEGCADDWALKVDICCKFMENRDGEVDVLQRSDEVAGKEGVVKICSAVIDDRPEYLAAKQWCEELFFVGYGLFQHCPPNVVEFLVVIATWSK